MGGAALPPSLGALGRVLGSKGSDAASSNLMLKVPVRRDRPTTADVEADRQKRSGRLKSIKKDEDKRDSVTRLRMKKIKERKEKQESSFLNPLWPCKLTSLRWSSGHVR